LHRFRLLLRSIHMEKKKTVSCLGWYRIRNPIQVVYRIGGTIRISIGSGLVYISKFHIDIAS
jgi:hypothetical protein